MMRKIFATTLFLLISTVLMAQQRVKITVQDSDSTRVYVISDAAQVQFEPYYEDLPDSIKIIDMGFGVKWASINYSRTNAYGFFNQFAWPRTDIVASDWAKTYGQKWRVPTVDDFEVLIDSCEWTPTDEGYNVYSPKTQNTLFLPFTGKNNGEKPKVGFYWTSDEDGTNTAKNFQISFDASLEEQRKEFHSTDKDDYMSIRPVFGESKSRVKISKPQPSIQNYRSATIQFSVGNVEINDVVECGVYYSVNEGLLPTNQNPQSQVTNVIAELNANNMANVSLDYLTSGETYYVCAYVRTAKGTTFSEPTSFTVDAMTVSFANSTAKSVGQTTATVTLNLQGYPLTRITKYGVRVTGGDLQSKEFFEEGAPSNMLADVKITGLTDKTEYTCSKPFAIFSNERIEGSGSLTFTTTDPRRVNEQFPIPEQAVDMGLPSGTKWAPYNLYYLPKPDSVSYFFGWGDPTGAKLSTGNDYADGKQILDIAGTQYDIATMQWNELEDLDPLRSDKWRLPTKADFEELFAYCKVMDYTQDGVGGLLFTNKTDPSKTVFFPLLGGMNALTHIISNVGTDGFYWTSEASLNKQAYRLRLLKALTDQSFELYPRGTRGCIRPVYGKKTSGEVTPPDNPDPQPGEDRTTTVKGYNTETEDGAETAYPYEPVDMGLPSGTKWAAWNVGAMKYGDIGKYYAWGEITTKDVFGSATYVAPVKGYQVYDLPDSVNVVKQLWGKGSGYWTMPGEEDFAELFTKNPENTDSLLYVSVRWETDEGQGNVYGMRVISRINGNSIFFPAGGYKPSGQRASFNSRGFYWTRTGSGINGKRTSHAVYFEFGSETGSTNGLYQEMYNLERYNGCMVRPVWKENSNARELTTP